MVYTCLKSNGITAMYEVRGDGHRVHYSRPEDEGSWTVSPEVALNEAAFYRDVAANLRTLVGAYEGPVDQAIADRQFSRLDRANALDRFAAELVLACPPGMAAEYAPNLYMYALGVELNQSEASN